MFKSVKTMNLLAHRMQVPPINTIFFVLIFIFFSVLPTAMGQESNVVEEAQKQVRSWWANTQVIPNCTRSRFASSNICTQREQASGGTDGISALRKWKLRPVNSNALMFAISSDVSVRKSPHSPTTPSLIIIPLSYFEHGIKTI